MQNCSEQGKGGFVLYIELSCIFSGDGNQVLATYAKGLGDLSRNWQVQKRWLQLHVKVKVEVTWKVS